MGTEQLPPPVRQVARLGRAAGTLVLDTMMDTRREVGALMGRLEVRSWRQAALAAGAAALAYLLAYVPAHEGLELPGRHALFILVFATGLWVSEAIPAFAVALVVIALEILLLGGLGRPGAEADWQRFIEPWASPLIWLFVGSFVLGKAATKTGLDRRLGGLVLRWSGPSPGRSLFGVMLATFAFSMFVSNTATAAMMIAVISPLISALDDDDPHARALLLAVPVAANLGGMGTLIGSPPNAIAAAALAAKSPVDFAGWILIGLPPALVLLGFTWLALRWLFPAKGKDVALTALEGEAHVVRLPRWRQLLVVGVFLATVLLWMTQSLHGIPTTVVSFLPITAFAAFGVLTAEDVRQLQWDVLLLMAGGLALGVAVSDTGLATYLVEALPVEALGAFALALGLAFVTAVLSNVMSNTAATTILVPIGLALAAGAEVEVVAPIALSASAAMCLPISTPPNAIAFASGRIDARDFLRIGALVGFVAPPLLVLWVSLIR